MQCVVVSAAFLAIATAAVYRIPDELKYPDEVYAHQRYARGIDVDPKTGTVSGQYPVGSGNVFGSVQGSEGKFGYKQNIFDNGHGRLDGTAYHGRTLGAGGSSSLGGRLDYTGGHGTGSLDVSRFNHGPTSVNAAGGGRWQLGRQVDASLQGTYSQTFGFGRRPEYGLMGTVNGRW